MDPHHNRWNAGQQKLRRALLAKHPEAIALFLDQHAMVHSGKLTGSPLWSFEDDLFQDTTEAQVRCVQGSAGHSIARILFHLARIEDITMNLLVAGTAQVFTSHGWAARVKTDIFHSGNAMAHPDIAALSARIDIRALRLYRQAVGRRTRQIVRKLKPQDYNLKLDPRRIQDVMEQGALPPEAIGILGYWSRRTVSGLLLMPPTRHNFLHLNEGLRIKKQFLCLPSRAERPTSQSIVSSED